MSFKKLAYKIHPLPVLTDNIIWIWVSDKEAVVIDPAIAEPVKNWLKKKELNLIAILQTHHHEDHIGRSLALLEQWPQANVIACKRDFKRIPFQTISVDHGDELCLMRQPIKVIGVTGHTNAHLAYYLPKTQDDPISPSLFCGDTLFAAGCGRVFEGTTEDMYKSLQRLKKLPSETEVFCAHEYTEDNLRWASSVFPEDFLINKRLQNIIKTKSEGKLTLPSTISEERDTNVFLRAECVEEFAKLRQSKDHWRS